MLGHVFNVRSILSLVHASVCLNEKFISIFRTSWKIFWSNCYLLYIIIFLTVTVHLKHDDVSDQHRTWEYIWATLYSDTPFSFLSRALFTSVHHYQSCINEIRYTGYTVLWRSYKRDKRTGMWKRRPRALERLSKYRVLELGASSPLEILNSGAPSSTSSRSIEI